uniref:Uncharacterized protein n=1 Tax=Plectus sambesii TaxID=2011161 RepID=A0A914UL84_9BILA
MARSRRRLLGVTGLTPPHRRATIVEAANIYRRQALLRTNSPLQIRPLLGFSRPPPSPPAATVDDRRKERQRDADLFASQHTPIGGLAAALPGGRRRWRPCRATARVASSSSHTIKTVVRIFRAQARRRRRCRSRPVGVDDGDPSSADAVTGQIMAGAHAPPNDNHFDTVSVSAAETRGGRSGGSGVDSKGA